MVLKEVTDRHQALRDDIQVAIDEIDHGQGKPWNAEEIKAELQTRRLAELRRGWLRDLRRVADIRVNERLLEQLRR